MLRAELHSVPAISRFFIFESALSYVIDIFKDETVKAVTEEQKKAIFSVLSCTNRDLCQQGSS
jgi:hypothetical protein